MDHITNPTVLCEYLWIPPTRFSRKNDELLNVRYHSRPAPNEDERIFTIIRMRGIVVYCKKHHLLPGSIKVEVVSFGKQHETR